VGNVRVGDWGRCAGSAEAYARLTHLGGSSAVGASSAILVLGICARQISQDYCRLQVQADFGVVFCLNSGADGSTTDGASTKISSASVVPMLRSFARSDSIDCCKAIVLSSSNLLVVDATSDVGFEIASESRGKVDALANEITYSLCGAKRILGDELFSVANDEQIQKAGKAIMPLVCRRSPD
jgi:hypothetical protein